VDRCDGGVVLACVFCSLPTTKLSGGFPLGRIYERGLILEIRNQSGYCQYLSYNKGGAGATPKDVAACGRCVGVVHRRPDGGKVVNGLDTALHITVLLHGLYFGAITTWLHWHDQAAGSHSWHDQMLN
jgi:hypothetical protein